MIKKLAYLSLTLMAFIISCNKEQKTQALPSAKTAITYPEAKDVLKMIKSGGYFIFLRHNHRDRYAIPEVQRDIDVPGKCVPGAELSPLGLAEAKQFKVTFEKEKLPSGKVYASPTCRTTQMAGIIFGENNITLTPTLIYDRILNEEEKSRKKPWFDDLYKTPIPAGENVYLIAHEGTVDPHGFTYEEGDGFVFKANGTETPEFIGKIDRKTWVH